MKIPEVLNLSITDLRGLYRNREVSPVEVVNAVVERIRAVDPKLNSFVRIMEEDALTTARKAGMRFVQDEQSSHSSEYQLP